MMDALGANRLPDFFLLPGFLTMGLDARWQLRAALAVLFLCGKCQTPGACSVLSVATASAES
jgi:hypothetical protein